MIVRKQRVACGRGFKPVDGYKLLMGNVKVDERFPLSLCFNATDNSNAIHFQLEGMKALAARVKMTRNLLYKKRSIYAKEPPADDPKVNMANDEIICN
jgi:hypothetical protein